MDRPDYYQPWEEAFRQGDTIADVPHIFLRPPLYALRRITLAKNREAMGFYQYPPAEDGPGGARGRDLPGGSFHFGEGEEVPAICRLALGIVLNHDCEIENEHEHRQLALIRPLEAVENEEHRELIVGNRNFSFFYLPADTSLGLPDSYVDFRRITSLAPAFLATGRPLTSLTEIAVKAFQSQLFRFWTHRDPQPPAS
jgi:hypothetical protein